MAGGSRVCASNAKGQAARDIGAGSLRTFTAGNGSAPHPDPLPARGRGSRSILQARPRNPPDGKNPQHHKVLGVLLFKTLAVSYSHMAAATLSSALSRFTSVFGMGTGGSNSLWPPGKLAEKSMFEVDFSNSVSS